MPADLENLRTLKSRLISTLTEITTTPKPSYSIDGQSIQWADYYRMIFDQLEKVNMLLMVEEGPFELSTQGYT